MRAKTANNKTRNEFFGIELVPITTGLLLAKAILLFFCDTLLRKFDFSSEKDLKLTSIYKKISLVSSLFLYFVTGISLFWKRFQVILSYTPSLP